MFPLTSTDSETSVNAADYIKIYDYATGWDGRIGRYGVGGGGEVWKGDGAPLLHGSLVIGTGRSGGGGLVPSLA